VFNEIKFRPVAPFDKYHHSDHVSVRGALRGYTDLQVRDCVENPDRIDKSQKKGNLGGFIWKFHKFFDGKQLTIVAEVY
jgi:hypothetical protein